MITKERLKYLMLDMLITDGNETIFMSKEGQSKYNRLIAVVAKAYYDIRFSWYKIIIARQGIIKFSKRKWFLQLTTRAYKRLRTKS